MAARTRDIVVGFDGSGSAQAALRWATRTAMLHRRAVTVVYVVAVPEIEAQAVAWEVDDGPVSLRVPYEQHARRIVTEALDIVDDEVGAGQRPEVVTDIIWAQPVPTLAAMTRDAELVVVGSRGQGSLRRAVMGSVSAGLVQHARCPVAVIHGQELSAEQAAEAARRPVLLGIDGSRASELATEVAFAEAAAREVDLIALHAWHDADLVGIAGQQWSDLVTRGEEVLAERLAGYREQYPDLTVRRLVVWGQPAHHLLEHAESAQLVVVGSHGRGGFTGMLLGSVSRAVVHGAEVPVIVARRF
ncbi:MAG TPA: universal stress protein [Mycolicibacillus parakoreensis]|nr:universal stress protein [Mycolicibacillus parakoreensis]